MTSKDEIEYKTTITNEHWRDEEFQWARILSQGNPAKGMVLLYIQKACTAFHEFEPAFKGDAIKPGHIEFFRRRMAARVKHVIVTMQNNGLDKINGAVELNEILESIESTGAMEELVEITEKLHVVNHTLLDSLEGR
jgi:hypothetical protein